MNSGDQNQQSRYIHDYSDRPATIKLIVNATDALTEVFLIDWNLKRVPSARGLGQLEIDVPPGIYKIRFQTANSIQDELVEVPEAAPGGVVRFSAPQKLDVDSPIPSAADSTSRAYIERVARQPQGEGRSQILLCIRDWDPPANHAATLDMDYDDGDLPVPATGNPGKGVTLYALDSGRTIFKLKATGCYQKGLRMACANVAVEPGNYLLRAETGAVGTVEIPLITRPDWQTVVFAQMRPLRYLNKTTWTADIAQASILMFQKDSFWDLDLPDIRASEQAKWALKQARPVISEALVNELLQGKWVNPMAGVMGLHLMLLDKKQNWDMFNLVLRNLVRLLGSHPDLLALALAVPAEHQSGVPGLLRITPDFSFPPMLERSWRLVLKAESNLPLIPEGSFTASLIPELPRGNLWLTWRRTRKSAKLAKVAVQRPVEALGLDRAESISGDPVESPMEADPADYFSKFQNALQDAEHTIQASAKRAKAKGQEMARQAYNQARSAYKMLVQRSEPIAQETTGAASAMFQQLKQNYETQQLEPIKRQAARPPKSPLDYLIVSWKDQYKEKLYENLQKLSLHSGIPLNVLQRTVAELE